MNREITHFFFCLVSLFIKPMNSCVHLSLKMSKNVQFSVAHCWMFFALAILSRRVNCFVYCSLVCFKQENFALLFLLVRE